MASQGEVGRPRDQTGVDDNVLNTPWPGNGVLPASDATAHWRASRRWPGAEVTAPSGSDAAARDHGQAAPPEGPPYRAGVILPQAHYGDEGA